MKKKKLYLGIPFSHKDEAVMEWRYAQANEMAGILMCLGYVVFSPVSHSNPIARTMPPEAWIWRIWKEQDFPWLECCDILFVFCLPGWKESTGLQAEIMEAKRLKMEVFYYHPISRGFSNGFPLKLKDRSF